MSTVSEVEGLPRFFVKDIPPRSPVGIGLSEPRIYFGEKTDDYVMVNAAAEEFDYPKGDPVRLRRGMEAHGNALEE